MSRRRHSKPASRSSRDGAARLLIAPAAALLALAACSDHEITSEPVTLTRTEPLANNDIVVDTSVQRQSITGFGASSAWTGSNISNKDADLFFSAESGLGLSLLRVHIAPDGTTTELHTAKLAVERGVAVWAAPWSPPGEWKTNDSSTQGGSLLLEQYQAWADRLSGFAAQAAAEGVPLVALSAQNEPNWKAEWETCVYTPEELQTFIRDYLGPALRRDSPGTRLLAPETIDWTTIASFTDPLLADAPTSAEIGIVAVHAYGGEPYAYTAPADNGKELWETEVSYDDQTGILATLDTAREVHRHLVDASVNAFHYWWLVSDTGGALMADGALTPQAYGLAHFSRFVRPGYVRLDVPQHPATGVSLSAYFDAASQRVVIVGVNESASAAPLSFNVLGTAPVEIEPWVTTADATLSHLAPVPFTSPFAYALSPQSVTTLVVSEVAEPPPVGTGGTTGAAGADGFAGASAGEAGANDAGGPGLAEGGAPATGSGGTGPDTGGGRTHSKGGTSSRAGSAGSNTGNDNGGEATGPSGVGGTNVGVTPRRRPGAYSACYCALPGSSGDGTPGAFAPFFALLALRVVRRRRAAFGA